MTRIPLSTRLLLVLPVLVLAACATGSGDDPAALPPATETSLDDGSAPDIAQMCAEGEPDCDDMVQVDPTALPAPGSGGVAPEVGTCLAGATECPDVPPVNEIPEGMEPTMVEPRDGLADVAPVPWVEVEPDDDQTALRVTWWSGNQDCYGLDHVEVTEADDAVTITVLQGRDPDVDICTEEAVLVATTVELDGELGPRSILDGAAES